MNQISRNLEYLNRILDEYNNQYNNFVFIGDFNVNVNLLAYFNIDWKGYQ